MEIVVAVVAVSVIAFGPNDQQTATSTPLELVAGESNALAKCKVMTSEIIAESEVAFAGTATTINEETVTLEVTKWYAGGDSTTVMVTRFRMRLKKRTIGERKNIGLPSSFIIICVSIARFCSFFKICVVS